MSRVTRLLNTTATVTRSATRVSDGMGGYTRSPSAVFERVPCRIQPASARERESAGRQEVRHDYTLYFEEDADLLRGDTLLVDGLTLGVELFISPSVRQVYMKVLASAGQSGPS